MCKLLDIPRSSLYYQKAKIAVEKPLDEEYEKLTNLVIEIFKNSRNKIGRAHV